MKEKIEYRYEFANGDVVELRISKSGSVGDEKYGITSEWLELLLDLDRREYNNNQTETRRHVSLNALDQDDNQIPNEKDLFEEFYEEETWKKQSLAYISYNMDFEKYGKPQKYYSVRSLNNFHKEAFMKLIS